MDEESDSTKNWVLVNKVDCSESDSAYKPELESDQESEGSISIISEHPTDSYSEEEAELLQKQLDDFLQKETAIMMTDKEKTAAKCSMQFTQVGTTEDAGDKHVEKITEDIAQVHQNIEEDASFTSGPSTFKKWAYIDQTSNPPSESEETPFYLDCSKEPILEISDPDTESLTSSEIRNEEEASNQQEEKQELIKRSDYAASKPREPVTNIPISKIGIGVFISVVILVGSHIIQLYSQFQDNGVQGLNDNVLEGLVDNAKAKAFLEFCIDRQKIKGDYSEQAVEKCVMKKWRKKNREETIQKTEIYLQMKEKKLALREKELVEKEREIMKKMRKFKFDGGDIVDYKKRNADYKTPNGDTKKVFGKNKIKNRFVDSDRERYHITHESEERFDTLFRKKEKHSRENIDKNQKNSIENNGKPFHTKVKQPIENDQKYTSKDSKENKDLDHKKHFKSSFKIVKEKIEKFREQHKKDAKTLHHNEEWYIKYNPMKNTIELINITTLPEQDSQLIKKGNKTINGQWYFSLYGTSRENIRNKEKAADWYFKRGNFRENKRDKAKWYFDYMASRDNTRY